MKFTNSALKALSAACWAKERVLDGKSHAGGRLGVGRKPPVKHRSSKRRKMRLRRLATRSRELSELDHVLHAYFLGEKGAFDLTPERIVDVMEKEQLLERFEVLRRPRECKPEAVKCAAGSVAEYVLRLALKTLRWHLWEVKRFNHAVMVQQRRAERFRRKKVKGGSIEGSGKRYSHRGEYATIRCAIRVFEKAVEARQLAVV